jgi:hypothetical protein
VSPVLWQTGNPVHTKSEKGCVQTMQFDMYVHLVVHGKFREDYCTFLTLVSWTTMLAAGRTKRAPSAAPCCSTVARRTLLKCARYVHA